MKNDILRFLRQEKGRDVYFTTMIDLYALPADFPGTDEADNLRHLPYERVAKLEERFTADIVDPWGRPTRFIPHIQLHEFEAILLCRPERFSSFFGDCPRQVEQLEEIAEEYESPELIDDGEQTAPSKRIAGRILRLQRREELSRTANCRSNRHRNHKTSLPAF